MSLLQILRSVVVLMLLFTSCAFGTAQEADKLIIEGKEEMLFTNPLQPWLEKNPGRLPKAEVMSSANWRGYVATWEIAAGKLLLKKVDIAITVAPPTYALSRDVLAELFPDSASVVADWYSGTLIIPQGEIVDYVHMGYGSTFQAYHVITLRNGTVVKDLRLPAADFLPYRKKQFAAYRQTAAFKESLEQLLKNNPQASTDRKAAEKSTIEFLFQFEAETYLSHEYTAPPQQSAVDGSKP